MSAQVEEVFSKPTIAGSFALAIVQGRQTVFDRNAGSEIGSGLLGASLLAQQNKEVLLSMQRNVASAFRGGPGALLTLGACAAVTRGELCDTSWLGIDHNPVGTTYRALLQR